MKIVTSRFGEIEIDQDKIIKFPMGLPGHSRLKRFFLVEHIPLVKWLHAVDDPDVAFITTDPFNFFQSYSFTINDSYENKLGIKEPSSIAVLVFLAIKGDQITANLKEPVVINTANKMAARIILEAPGYPEQAFLPGI